LKAHPLLLELDTRCWLRGLADKLARPVTLATVPAEEFRSWQERHFTHLWLMGAWASGPKARDLARAQQGLRALSQEAFGARGTEELTASPYAVADYAVAADLGGAAALRQFRATLRQHGIELVLDFVPNHLGLDHPWLADKTDLFVWSLDQRLETFAVTAGQGTRWVAHGKDPYFPAWSDTAQLDYRRQETRSAMIAAWQSVAAQCGGARCDMAMLLLNDVFDRTWAHFPARGPAPAGEFWAGAIAALKRRHPKFMCIAEAYWDLEPRLCALGFDYAYDKKFLDYVAGRDWRTLQEHLRAAGARFPAARFLENHDQPPIASVLGAAEHKAAAVLLLAQPGLRLLHDGQLAGRRRRTPVQFARYWPETPDPEITSFYDRLLALLPQTAVGRGEMEFCQTGLPHCFVMKWQADAGRLTLVSVNLAPHPAAFPLRDLQPGWEIRSLFADPESAWSWQDAVLQNDLAAHGFLMLELRRTFL
jgi:hypothetical protein